MEILISLLNTLNALSPLAVIGLLGTIIFMMVKGKTATDSKVETIATNHLHGLPDMAATLKDISQVLQRIELKMVEEFAHIRSRLNDRS